MRVLRSLAIVCLLLGACDGDTRPPLPALSDAPLSLRDDQSGTRRELATGRTFSDETPFLSLQLDDESCGDDPYPGLDTPQVQVLISPENLHTGEVEASVSVQTREGSRRVGIGVRSRVVLDAVESARIAGRISARDERFTISGAFTATRCGGLGTGDAGQEHDAGVLEPDSGPPSTPEGCAVSFPVSGAALRVDATDGLFDGAFTAELWARIDAFNPDSQAPQHFLALEGHGPTDSFGDEIRPTFYMGVWGEELGCHLGAIETVVSSNATVPVSDGWLGVWHHVACTLDTGRLALWIDGELAAFQDDPHPIFTPGYPLMFGTAPEGTPYQTLGLLGALDEIRISAGVVHEAYVDLGSNLFKADAFVPEARASEREDTRALWHFDECAGMGAASGVGTHPAELVGGAVWE